MTVTVGFEAKYAVLPNVGDSVPQFLWEQHTQYMHIVV